LNPRRARKNTRERAVPTQKDAKIIAGGQSLLPVMKLRLAAPELLIDLAKIDSLKGVRDDGDAIVIGAMTPHFEVARDPLVAEHASLIARCVETVADPQVRHRGTIGGACAHADPAGDLPAPMLALEVESKISSRLHLAMTRSWSRSGYRNTPAGVRRTRSLSGWLNSGRSPASRRPSGPRAAQLPRPGSP
jgi:CO/xanthine dehydrogenase FAD-binding subunit